MKLKTAVGLQVILWMVCAFHVLMGAALNASSEFVEPAARMYGADVAAWSPQFLYILRPLGVFMFALGVMAAAAAIDPHKYRVVIYVFAGIFVIRALQRIVFGTEISEIFGIDGARNVANMVFFFALAGTLAVLDVLSRRGANTTEQPVAAG